MAQTAGFAALFLAVVMMAALSRGTAQSPVVLAQEGPTPAQGEAATLVSPIAGNWTLLVNLDEGGAPLAVMGSLRRWATTVFTFDAGEGRFRTFRVGQPQFSDLATIESGQAFWVFVPPTLLDGDLTFWEQPATVGNLSVELRPGFNLAAWTGATGVRVSVALEGIAVRRAYLWDVTAQRFAVWNPSLPASLRDDFELEYGAGLWIDLAGTALVVWEQP